MVFNRFRAELQLTCNLFGVPALGDEPEDLALAGR
jgi:hypothetical protein